MKTFVEAYELNKKYASNVVKSGVRRLNVIKREIKRLQKEYNALPEIADKKDVKLALKRELKGLFNGSTFEVNFTEVSESTQPVVERINDIVALYVKIEELLSMATEFTVALDYYVNGTTVVTEAAEPVVETV